MVWPVKKLDVVVLTAHTIEPIASKLVLVIAPVCPLREVTPLAGIAELTQLVPSEVSTLPAVPVELMPVPPRAATKVPDAILFAFKFVTFAPEPLNAVAVIVAPVKLPEESRATIVDAPFELDAVVLALSIVPLEILEAFKFVMFAPENAAVAEPVPPLATGRTPFTFDCKLA
jgi:hypothetical protein